MREYLDQGGAANARAPGRAGGDWTLLMAAAEGGKDGRERYNEHCRTWISGSLYIRSFSV